MKNKTKIKIFSSRLGWESSFLNEINAFMEKVEVVQISTSYNGYELLLFVLYKEDSDKSKNIDK